MGKSESWNIVVSAQSNKIKFNFAELWAYRDLIKMFVKRDFVSFYKQTVLGPLWYILQPLLTTFIYSLVFSRIAKLSTDGLPPLVFYLSGITIWTFFSECLVKTSNTFISNASIFGKVYFPRLTVPVSIIFSNLITLCIQLILFLVVILYYTATGAIHTNIQWTIFLLPIFLLIVSGLGLGLGIFISALTTKYRDLRFAVTFGVQLLMFMSPVIQPVSNLSENHRTVLLLNPMSSIIEAFRYSFFGTGYFSPAWLAYSGCFMLFILVIGIAYFNKIEKSFMDNV